MPSPPTKTGYTFAGWNTASNGSGAEFIYSTPVTTADINVYAKWVSNTNTVYAVTYDSEGGTTVGTQYVTPSGSNVGTLPSDPTRPFYTFDRWWEEADDGGGQFTAGIAVTKNMIVHAHWIAAPGCTVTYDSQGGTAVDPQYVIPSRNCRGNFADATYQKMLHLCRLVHGYSLYNTVYCQYARFDKYSRLCQMDMELSVN